MNSLNNIVLRLQREHDLLMRQVTENQTWLHKEHDSLGAMLDKIEELKGSVIERKRYGPPHSTRKSDLTHKRYLRAANTLLN